MYQDPNSHGWFCHEETMTELLHEAVRGHLIQAEPNAVLNIETHLFNVTLSSETCECKLDMGKHLWLNRQRWSRLIKEYVPREALVRFIEQAKYIFEGDARKGATANMMFRDPKRYEKKHKWGGCMMGATFRGEEGNHPTITFYSRTTYMGYIGFLDAAIAHCMAREIATPEVIGFRWHISSQQLHCFKTLPYIYSQPDLMRHLEKLGRNRRLIDKQRPTWRHVAKWYCKVLDHFEEHGVGMLDVEKYGPLKRIKRRWLEYKEHLDKNVPPSCPVDTLNFDKAI